MKKKRFFVLERAPAVLLPVIAVAADGITAFAAETGSKAIVDTTVVSLASAVRDMMSSVSSAVGQVIPHALNIVMIVLIIMVVLSVFGHIRYALWLHFNKDKYWPDDE